MIINFAHMTIYKLIKSIMNIMLTCHSWQNITYFTVVVRCCWWLCFRKIFLIFLPMCPHFFFHFIFIVVGRKFLLIFLFSLLFLGLSKINLPTTILCMSFSFTFFLYEFRNKTKFIFWLIFGCFFDEIKTKKFEILEINDLKT